jgi:hypothetical protein
MNCRAMAGLWFGTTSRKCSLADENLTIWPEFSQHHAVQNGVCKRVIAHPGVQVPCTAI